jgi:hypothetical protein
LADAAQREWAGDDLRRSSPVLHQAPSPALSVGDGVTGTSVELDGLEGGTGGCTTRAVSSGAGDWRGSGVPNFSTAGFLTIGFGNAVFGVVGTTDAFALGVTEVAGGAGEVRVG